MEEIIIDTEFIKLDSLLKYAAVTEKLKQDVVERFMTE